MERRGGNDILSERKRDLIAGQVVCEDARTIRKENAPDREKAGRFVKTHIENVIARTAEQQAVRSRIAAIPVVIQFHPEAADGKPTRRVMGWDRIDRRGHWPKHLPAINAVGVRSVLHVRERDAGEYRRQIGAEWKIAWINGDRSRPCRRSSAAQKKCSARRNKALRIQRHPQGCPPIAGIKPRVSKTYSLLELSRTGVKLQSRAKSRGLG